MLVPEQAFDSKWAVLVACGHTEVEEVSTVLSLKLIAIVLNCSLSELLLAVCIFAAGFPALGCCNPCGAESVAFFCLKLPWFYKVLEIRVENILLFCNPH